MKINIEPVVEGTEPHYVYVYVYVCVCVCVWFIDCII